MIARALHEAVASTRPAWHRHRRVHVGEFQRADQSRLSAPVERTGTRTGSAGAASRVTGLGRDQYGRQGCARPAIARAPDRHARRGGNGTGRDGSLAQPTTNRGRDHRAGRRHCPSGGPHRPPIHHHDCCSRRSGRPTPGRGRDLPCRQPAQTRASPGPVRGK